MHRIAARRQQEPRSRQQTSVSRTSDPPSATLLAIAPRMMVLRTDMLAAYMKYGTQHLAQIAGRVARSRLGR